MPLALLNYQVQARSRGRSRLLRVVLAGFAATGIAAAVGYPAAAAPVGVPVDAGGHAVGWGLDQDWQATAPAPPAGQTHTAVAAGYSHSLALTADGHIQSWGNDQLGQLRSTPSGGGYTAIAGGGDYSVALTADGHIEAWGENSVGQLDGIPSGGGHTAIAAGFGHALALTADGHIEPWGFTAFGQLNGIPSGGGYTAIAAGLYHSVALTADGHIVPWGNAEFGQVDDIPADGGYTAIAAGNNHSVALTADGHIQLWGYRSWTAINLPTRGGHTAIAAGDLHSLAVDTGLKLAGNPAFARRGFAYEYRFTVIGHPTPTTRVTAGVLPSGLELDPATGVLSGRPTTAGAYPFTLTTSNGVSTPVSLDVTVYVDEPWATSPFGSLGSIFGS